MNGNDQSAHHSGERHVPPDDPVAVAIAALTIAATRTRPGLDGRPERVDFAEIACHLIATVAANLGGVDELLAGRPGSWEADYIRNIVYSTAGDDPQQLIVGWRTEPIVLHLDPYEVFDECGLTGMHDADLDTAQTELSQAEGTTAEPLTEQVWMAVEDLYEQDIAAYLASYEQTVRAELDQRGITVPVHVRRVEFDGPRDVDWLSLKLHAAASARTPLPATGLPPVWGASDSPAAAVRAAGRSYLDRARAAVAVGDPTPPNGPDGGEGTR